MIKGFSVYCFGDINGKRIIHFWNGERAQAIHDFRYSNVYVCKTFGETRQAKKILMEQGFYTIEIDVVHENGMHQTLELS